MLNIFKTKNQKKGEKVVLKLSGLHCTSCSLNIDGELEDLAGVISANTSYAKSECKIEFEPNKISEKKLKQTIEKLGYKIIS